MVAPRDLNKTIGQLAKELREREVELIAVEAGSILLPGRDGSKTIKPGSRIRVAADRAEALMEAYKLIYGL